MIRDPFKLDQLAQRAEAELQRRVAKAQARAERASAKKAARLERWPRWTAWWEKRAKEIKIAATVVGGLVAIVTGAPILYRNAGAAWRHTGGALWAIWHARDAERTALPPPTNMPTTAFDFTVTRGRPPDGGSNR